MEGRDAGWREREKGLGKKLRGRVRERRVRKRDRGNRGVDHRPAIDYLPFNTESTKGGGSEVREVKSHLFYTFYSPIFRDSLCKLLQQSPTQSTREIYIG